MKDRIMMKLLGTIVGLLVYSAAWSASPTSKKSWEFIGSKNIGLTYDKDVIYVEDYRALYTAIELRTDKKQIDLHRCVVYYENGDRQDVKLRRDNRGSETHVIELEGGARAIDRIAIWGSRDYGKIFRALDKGTVEIWGQVAKRKDKNKGTQYYSSRNDDYYRERNRRVDIDINWNNRYRDRRNDYRRDRREAERRDRRRDDRRRRTCP